MGTNAFDCQSSFFALMSGSYIPSAARCHFRQLVSNDACRQLRDSLTKLFAQANRSDRLWSREIGISAVMALSFIYFPVTVRIHDLMPLMQCPRKPLRRD